MTPDTGAQEGFSVLRDDIADDACVQVEGGEWRCTFKQSLQSQTAGPIGDASVTFATDLTTEFNVTYPPGSTSPLRMPRRSWMLASFAAKDASSGGK